MEEITPHAWENSRQALWRTPGPSSSGSFPSTDGRFPQRIAGDESNEPTPIQWSNPNPHSLAPAKLFVLPLVGLLCLGLVHSQPAIAAESDAGSIIANQIDPAKLATLGERKANPRMPRLEVGNGRWRSNYIKQGRFLPKYWRLSTGVERSQSVI